MIITDTLRGCTTTFRTEDVVALIEHEGKYSASMRGYCHLTISEQAYRTVKDSIEIESVCKETE